MHLETIWQRKKDSIKIQKGQINRAKAQTLPYLFKLPSVWPGVLFYQKSNESLAWSYERSYCFLLSQITVGKSHRGQFGEKVSVLTSNLNSVVACFTERLSKLWFSQGQLPVCSVFAQRRIKKQIHNTKKKTRCWQEERCGEIEC